MPTVCVKIGGSAIDGPEQMLQCAESVAALSREAFPVVVHGGGKEIGRRLAMTGKSFTFVQGMRVTDEESLAEVQRVLSGDVNKRLVGDLLGRGVRAAGISGVDAGLIEAEKMTVDGRDIGLVGKVARVNTSILDVLREAGIVAVVSPVSRGSDGAIYNVNADTAAEAIAAAMKADHLIFLSNVPGVMIDGSVRGNIPRDTIESLIADGSVGGGMVPKLLSARRALHNGVARVHITGGLDPDTLTAELNPDTSRGTIIC